MAQGRPLGVAPLGPEACVDSYALDASSAAAAVRPLTLEEVSPHAGMVGVAASATLTRNLYHAVRTDGPSYGRLSGDAFVVMASEQEALKALAHLSQAPRDIRGRSLTFSVTAQGELMTHLAQQERRGLGADGDYEGVLRTRGWSWGVRMDEILGFFHGFTLASREPRIAYARRPDGRFTGEVFVAFEGEAEARRALAARHNQPSGGRHIECFPSVKSEIYAALGGSWFVRHDASSRAALYLRGLPFTAGPDDVAAFLGAHLPDVRNVFITMLPTGRPSGDAYVLTTTDGAAEAAAAAVAGKSMKDRAVDTSVCRRGELYTALSRPSSGMVRDGRSERDGADIFLRLRGLPFQATEREVSAFFEGFGMRRCLLVTSHDGRCSGEFKCYEQRSAACALFWGAGPPDHGAARMSTGCCLLVLVSPFALSAGTCPRLASSALRSESRLCLPVFSFHHSTFLAANLSLCRRGLR